MHYLTVLLHIILIEGFQIQSKIINDASPGQIPYQVLLRSTAGITCGGSILNEKWIVTAAHCYNSGFKHYIFVGSVKFNSGIKYEIDQIVVHDNYDNKKLINDIALMETRKRMLFNPYVRPIDLPAIPLPVHSTLIASGWGRTIAFTLPLNLRIIKMRSLADSECPNYGIYLYTQGEMCVLAYNDIGLCSGDSGGPLVSLDNTLEGITSFGSPKSYANGVTRVYYFVDWIRSII